MDSLLHGVKSFRPLLLKSLTLLHANVGVGGLQQEDICPWLLSNLQGAGGGMVAVFVGGIWMAGEP